jgi:hypothetical protein
LGVLWLVAPREDAAGDRGGTDSNRACARPRTSGWTSPYSSIRLIAAGAAAHDDVEATYHGKYDRYGPEIVRAVTGPDAHKVTVRLVPLA